MAINVTQKDATLNEIIRWCEAHHITRVSEHDMFANGYNRAIDNVATHCRNNLGYTGHMQHHTMTVTLDASMMISRYQCTCGYWTGDKDEASTHIKENAQCSTNS